MLRQSESLFKDCHLEDIPGRVSEGPQPKILGNSAEPATSSTGTSACVPRPHIRAQGSPIVRRVRNRPSCVILASVTAAVHIYRRLSCSRQHSGSLWPPPPLCSPLSRCRACSSVRKRNPQHRP